MWGCLAIGILPNTHIAAGSTSLFIQALGTLVYCVWAFVTMSGIFLALKAVGMLRVSAEEEQIGLDVCEHGMHAYPSPLSGLAGAAPVMAASPVKEVVVSSPIAIPNPAASTS